MNELYRFFFFLRPLGRGRLLVATFPHSDYSATQDNDYFLSFFYFGGGWC